MSTERGASTASDPAGDDREAPVGFADGTVRRRLVAVVRDRCGRTRYDRRVEKRETLPDLHERVHDGGIGSRSEWQPGWSQGRSDSSPGRDRRHRVVGTTKGEKHGRTTILSRQVRVACRRRQRPRRVRGRAIREENERSEGKTATATKTATAVRGPLQRGPARRAGAQLPRDHIVVRCHNCGSRIRHIKWRSWRVAVERHRRACPLRQSGRVTRFKSWVK